MWLHAYKPPPRSHHEATLQPPFSQSPPMSKLPTHMANLAQVRFTHDMAAQINISACGTLTPEHAKTCNRGAYQKHNMNMCLILMRPIPPLRCQSSCMGPHMGFAQRAYRAHPYW